MEDSRHAVSDKVRDHFQALKSGQPIPDSEKDDNGRKPLEGDWYLSLPSPSLSTSHDVVPRFLGVGLFAALTFSPICFEDLGESSLQDTVFCKAMCGNNIHKECFDQWARSKRQEGVEVTCGTPPSLAPDPPSRYSHALPTSHESMDICATEETNCSLLSNEMG